MCGTATNIPYSRQVSKYHGTGKYHSPGHCWSVQPAQLVVPRRGDLGWGGAADGGWCWLVLAAANTAWAAASWPRPTCLRRSKVHALPCLQLPGAPGLPTAHTVSDRRRAPPRGPGCLAACLLACVFTPR